VNHHLTIYRNTPCTVLGQSFYNWHKYLFEELARHLAGCGIDVALEDRETFEVRTARTGAVTIPLRDSLGILYDDQTRTYRVLDCHDHVETDDLALFVGDDRCRRVLKCQYRAEVLQGPGYEKIAPWTYFDRFWPSRAELLVAARQAPRSIPLMFFRGADWDRRAGVLGELRKRKLTNPDFSAVRYSDYMREAGDYRVMLSLPGFADFCNRDVECFGSGACVLRPRLKNEFHDALIPDHHYVSVDTDYRSDPPTVVADRIEQRFHEIILDPEYMNFVAGNAARWYDANVRVGPAMALTARLLGLQQPARRLGLQGRAGIRA